MLRNARAGGPRPFVFLLAVLALLPACGVLRVEAPEDGVTVKQLTADLAFGAEEEPVVASSSGFVEQPWVAAVVGLLFEGFDDLAAPPVRLQPYASFSSCPEAAPNAFPAEEATQSVKNGPPKAGGYRWRQTGTLEIPGLLPKTPIDGFSTRSLKSVREAGGTTFYDYVIAGGLTGIETQSIEVRADGVYMSRLQFAAGNSSIDFTPFPLPLKLFSLPIVTGEAISATGVDPLSGFTFTLTGRMGARDRIDACGTVIDAWKFEGTRVLRSVVPNDTRGVQSTTYNFLFAPQLGGKFVGERAVTTGTIGPLVYQSDLTSTIGELVPGRPE